MTMPLPRSGCFTTSRMGTAARARTLRRSPRPRPSGRRAQKVATVTMSTRVAKAEGWIWTGPTWIQRVAPSALDPMPVNMASRARTMPTYSTALACSSQR